MTTADHNFCFPLGFLRSLYRTLATLRDSEGCDQLIGRRSQARLIGTWRDAQA
jgi:hypothetical protein